MTAAAPRPPLSADFLVDEGRFPSLRRLFEALRGDKEADCFRGYEEWLCYLDPGARDWLWWPSPDELDTWSRRYESRPRVERAACLGPNWDFGSLIDAVRNGAYALGECVLVAPGRARIGWTPRVASDAKLPPELRALVEAFGGLLA